MARKKEISKYPKEYFELFRMANSELVTITCDSIAQAEATRNDLYTFRSVLYHSIEHEELALLAQNVRLSIQGTTLTAEPIIYRRKKDGN